MIRILRRRLVGSTSSLDLAAFSTSGNSEERGSGGISSVDDGGSFIPGCRLLSAFAPVGKQRSGCKVMEAICIGHLA